ncbi:hypothetical protein [Lacticaseibacillus saniviri]
MGTLQNQKPRFDFITEDVAAAFSAEIENIAKTVGISHADALADFLALAKIDDYDRKDEQLAGFGKLLDALNVRLYDISLVLREAQR